MSEVYRTELTPLSFLERSSIAYPTKTAIVHGDRKLTFEEMVAQARKTASALRASGIEPGDRVAYLCPNITEMLIARFADDLDQLHVGYDRPTQRSDVHPPRCLSQCAGRDHPHRAQLHNH